MTDALSTPAGSALAPIPTAVAAGRGRARRTRAKTRSARRRAWVPATPTQQAVSVLLATVSAVILALLVNLVAISPLQHASAQTALYEQLRLTLAEGSTPIGPLDVDGKPVALGTPVAVLTSSVVNVKDEVIVEGTAAAQTMVGIGHRRDSVMPCQAGTSVLMARSGAYGGVGAAWARLTPGQQVTVTMGEGTCRYEVTGIRHVGDQAPPAPAHGQGRLVLTTGAGTPYMPNEVLRIDAELQGEAFNPSGIAYPTGALPAAESAMGTDSSSGVLFGLVLLLELLIAASLAAAWLWRRWGHWQTWIVALPVLAAVAVLTASAVNQWLLPNLL